MIYFCIKTSFLFYYFIFQKLADPELRRTLWSLVAFPKLKRQLLLMDPVGLAPKDFTENTLFWINQDFAIIKNGRIQRRGKVTKKTKYRA